MIHILVTGGNGQLANCIKEVSLNYALKMKFSFRSSEEVDITDPKSIDREFKAENYDYCINCAAYTNVDGAQTNFDLADKINRKGAKHLADACKANGVVLIHISTDFVFDGSKSLPYSEEDATNGLSVYGKTKLFGEKEIRDTWSDHFILRTSWLYSEYGNNFMKSMLKYGSERNELSIVYDQIGTPTYAKDLAETVLILIDKNIKSFGTYHYSNEGVASWYDFAKAIFEINNIPVKVIPIRSSEYPLPAKRPAYSVLDKSKIKKTVNLTVPYWRESLIQASKSLQTTEYQELKQ